MAVKVPRAINDISFEDVSKLLAYDPEVGGSCLKWKSDRLSGRYHKIIKGYAGQMAGGVNGDGYYHVRVNGRKYKAHRLVWLLCTGEWPKDHIDHIDRDKSNNRIENLREANYVLNMQNRGKPTTNKSGFIGVSFFERTGRWVATIGFDNKCHYLGSYVNAEDASRAYEKAKIDLLKSNRYI